MYYGAAYYPEHREPERWEYDLQNMSDAGVNCLRVAEFAWVLLEPSDGTYDFSWLDKFKNMASAHGIQLLLCPPLRTLPAWLVEQDRGLLIEDDRGHILEFGSRYSFCINHPLLLQKGKALAVAMAEHYGNDSDIAGWHLDNEHGDEPDCHCPICRKNFQQWCEEKHKTIDALNEAWGLRFWGLNFQSFRRFQPRVLPKHFTVLDTVLIGGDLEVHAQLKQLPCRLKLFGIIFSYSNL
jgi:beta-galactosidase